MIELLSESTANGDKTEKKLIYQNQMRVLDYFWYDPFNPDDWVGFSLPQGVYHPLMLNEQQQLVSAALGLALQRWQGHYKGIDATWLRWATLDGTLLPTPEEQEHQRAEQEHQRAEQERQRAEQAEDQLWQTAQNLLAGGMTVDQVAQVTGLERGAVSGLAQDWPCDRTGLDQLAKRGFSMAGSPLSSKINHW